MTRRITVLSVLFHLLLLATTDVRAAEDRRTQVLHDRSEVQASGEWIYNDLPKAIEVAYRSKKPLLVVIRCIP